jgi:hypothetical protein
MLNSTFPCCSNTLLRHIRSGEVYWFCCHCHQEMPNYTAILSPSKYYTKRACVSRLAKNNTSARNALVLSCV